MRRLSIFAGSRPELLEKTDSDAVFLAMKRCPCSRAWAALKTWCDGRLASSRILHPAGVRCCAFGSLDQRDSLANYPGRPSFHNAMEVAVGHPLPRDAVEKRAFVNPS
eukprot:3102043-Pyramimonas_sp.AAC.1